MPKKKRSVDSNITEAQSSAKAELKLLAKGSIKYAMSLVDFNGSARTYPRSAAQVAWFAYIFRQLKTAPYSVVDAFLESGNVTRDESLLIRQLRAADTVKPKEEE